MSLRCRLLDHDYKVYEMDPSQTFKVPSGSDDPTEYIKRTTKSIHHKCSRCGSTKTEQVADEELVFDEWAKKNKQTQSSVAQERADSYRAHQAAKDREPPVELGEIVKGGVTELKNHHTGMKEAVIRVGTFVIFVSDLPDGVEKGDILQAKITSFGSEMTCGYALFKESHN